ncbi:GOLPH3/VPS74 family protein [Kitasatospora sp. NBC_01266]|uniref:GOLPH3/VPS74 family protein n=1 Tax=Kitasatospora sp. NBC_01266 TaxID=2903572 RepID=UPI002E339B1D|nr:GPP34 family phosphoprotein [Kitasatospora sp. NBC_01266]
MDLPDTLPGRLYLLAFRPGTRQFSYHRHLGLLMRAAALTELLQRGLLVDDRGRPQPGRPAPPELDPVLATVLAQVAGQRRRRLLGPRSWRGWIAADAGATERAVRDRLRDDGLVIVSDHRAPGLFPNRSRVRCDPHAHRQLVALVEAVLTDPLDTVEPRQAALVSLAAAGELDAVLDARTRRVHRDRIRELKRLTGPTATALRREITAKRSGY